MSRESTMTQQKAVELAARRLTIINELRESIAKALEVITSFGGIDGAHHKDWVLDQAVRHLLGDEYDSWVTSAKSGEDGPDTYSWNEGIAP
jgi:hypothetical protein